MKKIYIVKTYEDIFGYVVLGLFTSRRKVFEYIKSHNIDGRLFIETHSTNVPEQEDIEYSFREINQKESNKHLVYYPV